LSPDVLRQPNIGPLIDLIAQWTYARMFVDSGLVARQHLRRSALVARATIIPQLKGNLRTSTASAAIHAGA